MNKDVIFPWRGMLGTKEKHSRKREFNPLFRLILSQFPILRWNERQWTNFNWIRSTIKSLIFSNPFIHNYSYISLLNFTHITSLFSLPFSSFTNLRHFQQIEYLRIAPKSIPGSIILKWVWVCTEILWKFFHWILTTLFPVKCAEHSFTFDKLVW